MCFACIVACIAACSNDDNLLNNVIKQNEEKRKNISKRHKRKNQWFIKKVNGDIVCYRKKE